MKTHFNCSFFHIWFRILLQVFQCIHSWISVNLMAITVVIIVKSFQNDFIWNGKAEVETKKKHEKNRAQHMKGLQFSLLIVWKMVYISQSSKIVFCILENVHIACHCILWNGFLFGFYVVVIIGVYLLKKHQLKIMSLVLCSVRM